jgi:hypothetical protein
MSNDRGGDAVGGGEAELRAQSSPPAGGITTGGANVVGGAIPAFARGWAAAVAQPRDNGVQVLADRAIDGTEERIFYRGELIDVRRRHDSPPLLTRARTWIPCFRWTASRSPERPPSGRRTSWTRPGSGPPAARRNTPPTKPNASWPRWARSRAGAGLRAAGYSPARGGSPNTLSSSGVIQP